jgi:hypothetical protein
MSDEGALYHYATSGAASVGDLLVLATHHSPVVRDAAVRRLALHRDMPAVVELLRRVAGGDIHGGVRIAAREALEDF